MNKDFALTKTKTLIKIILALLLLFGLYKIGSIDYKNIIEIFNKPSIILGSILCLFSGLVLGGLRWSILLDISGHPFRKRTAIKLQLIGGFFSTYLPGAAGGDLVRAAYILKIVPRNEGRTTAMLSIALDRLFALMGLICVAAAAATYVFLHDLLGRDLGPYTQTLLLMIIASPIGIFCLFASIFIIPDSFTSSFLPARFQAYIQIFRSLIYALLDRWKSSLCCVALSILASAIVIIGIILIADAFTFAPEPIVTAIAGVFGNVFSAIPITPGGVGVGESAFLAISRELSDIDAPYASIYLTFRAMMLIANFPGGILAIQDRLKKNS
jgi:uncharacterized protein (TIRG00374 family)